MSRLTTLPFLTAFICLAVLSKAQRIVVQFDAPLATTPSVSKAKLAYNKDFAYSFTFDDATDDAFTAALPVFRGGLVRANNATFAGLYFTDGCGNALPFRGGIAWNSANMMGIDVHDGNVPGQMTWRQLDTLYDNGWDVMNHSFSHKSRWIFPMTGNDYLNEIEANNITVRNKTRQKVSMPMFVVPSGDNYYYGPALQSGHRAVFDQGEGTIGLGGWRVDTAVNLFQLRLHRQYVEDVINQSLPRIDTVAARSKNGVVFWYNEFAHRIDNFSTDGSFGFYRLKSHWERIANIWGRSGSDRMWMAPLQEVYEYLMMRETVNFSVRRVNNTLEIDFDQRIVPTWMRRKAITLVVNSNVTFSRVVVPSGIKTTFNGRSATKIINLDFSNFLPTDTDDLPPNAADTEGAFTLFPNPTAHQIALRWREVPTEDAVVTVFDVNGKIVLRDKSFGQTQTLKTENLAAGVYFLMVRQGKKIYREKFIKN